MNFLTEHKIEQYTELTAKIAEITEASEQATEERKGVERRLADMAVPVSYTHLSDPVAWVHGKTDSFKNVGDFFVPKEKIIKYQKRVTTSFCGWVTCSILKKVQPA